MPKSGLLSVKNSCFWTPPPLHPTAGEVNAALPAEQIVMGMVGLGRPGQWGRDGEAAAEAAVGSLRALG